MATEWVRWAVLRYVRDVAAYDRRMQAAIERGQAIRAQMEGIGAIRYDRDGSASTWSDHLPDALDTLAEIADHLESDVALWAKDAEKAKELFFRYAETTMVWEKWGERLTWAKVAKMHGYSEGGARKMAERGMEIIYELMPEEYRRSPYGAEPWNRGR